MSQVRVIARAEAAEGKSAELKATLVQLVEPTRKEKGCLYYEFFESNIDGIFYFNELWEKMDDLKAHGSTPGFNAIIGKAQAFVKVPMEVNLVTQVA